MRRTPPKYRLSARLARCVYFELPAHKQENLTPPRGRLLLVSQPRGNLLSLRKKLRVHGGHSDGHPIVFLDDEPLSVHLAIDIGRPGNNIYLLSILPGKFADLDVVSISDRTDDMDGLFRDLVLHGTRKRRKQSFEILLVRFPARIFARRHDVKDEQLLSG